MSIHEVLAKEQDLKTLRKAFDTVKEEMVELTEEKLRADDKLKGVIWATTLGRGGWEKSSSSHETS